MADRVTKRDRFENLLDVVDVAAANGLITEDEANEHGAFIAHEVELLSRKGKADGPTKNQRINDGLKAEIAVLLNEAGAEGMTSTAVGTGMGFTVQKATSLLKQMVDAGDAVRVAGKSTLFYAPEFAPAA